MRLWVRLTLAMAVVTLLPLVVTGGLALRTATDAAQRTSEKNQQLSAALQADFVGVWVDGQVGFLRGWRDVYAGRLQALEPRLQSGFLQSVFRATRPVVIASLVTRGGEPVVDAVFMQNPPVGRVAGSLDRVELLHDLAPLEELGPDRPVAIGALYVPEPGGPPSVPVAVYVADGPDSPDGRPGWLALVAELTLAEVVGSLQAGVSDNLGIALLDGAGVARFGGGHPLVRPALIRPLAGNDSTFDYALEGGRRAHGETAPVEGTDWTVVVVEPLSVVFATVESTRRTLQGTVAFSVVIALLLGLSVAQTMTAPLTRLRDSVLQVADGRFGQQVSTSGGGELTELARAFNVMSTRLATAQAEVDDKQNRIEMFNRELQDRVEERTVELREAQGELVRSGQLAAVAEVGAGLAHELNNPLAGILGLTQLLRSRHGNGSDAALLGDIESQAQRCREVVEAMQRFANADVDPISKGVVSLGAVLDEVEALVGGPFRQRGVQLQIEPPVEQVNVGLDPLQGARLFAQILQSLRAGMSEGTTLRVRVAHEGALASVLFTADREVAGTLSLADDQRAASLGLWVARQLADRNEGSLTPLAAGEGWKLQLPVVSSGVI